jgi:sulfur-carrier protein
VTRVVLPQHLRTLAGVDGEVDLEIRGDPTAKSVIDAIEARFPVLEGTIRDQHTKRRRPYVRYYAAGLDLSHEPEDNPLPAPVAAGDEPFIVLGAISGG